MIDDNIKILIKVAVSNKSALASLKRLFIDEFL